VEVLTPTNGCKAAYKELINSRLHPLNDLGRKKKMYRSKEFCGMVMFYGLFTLPDHELPLGRESIVLHVHQMELLERRGL
jgi:hypothetical protein